MGADRASLYILVISLYQGTQSSLFPLEKSACFLGPLLALLVKGVDTGMSLWYKLSNSPEAFVSLHDSTIMPSSTFPYFVLAA